MNSAELEFQDGHLQQALRFANEALEIDLRGMNATNISVDYINGAGYRIALGELSEARRSAKKGLRFAREARVESLIAVSLQHLALLAGLDGDVPRAAKLLGYVEAQYSRLGVQREPTEQWGYVKLVTVLGETLSEDLIAKLAVQGATWSEDHAVEQALKA